MRTINMVKATNRTWSEKPTLFIKFSGTKAGVREAIDIVGKIAKNNNGGKFEFAKSEKEKYDLWSARKEALFSVLSLREKEGEVWTTDGISLSLVVCVGCGGTVVDGSCGADFETSGSY